jgi:hypothetical protein
MIVQLTVSPQGNGPPTPTWTPLGKVTGVMRSVSEIRAVVRWAQLASAVVVAGVSMGTSVIDPLRVDPAPPPHRRRIVGAWHDRMAMRDPTVELQERWGAQLYWYDRSHVGHMFSRRVQKVIDRFLREVAG